MVCVYCSHETKVTNSRLQKKPNQVWRRRQCLHCGAIFSTIEAVNTGQALRFQDKKQFEPFSRDKLFLSLHDSLKHRKTALSDATALTETVMSKLLPHIQHATIDRTVVIELTATVLNNFDKPAATSYRAFHPN